MLTVSVTKALAAAGNYTAKDVMCENATTGTVWTFAVPTHGYIVKAQAICETTALTPVLTLYLFKAIPTSELRDNVANTAVTHADLVKYIGRINFPGMSNNGGDSEAIAVPGDSGLPLAYTDARYNIYGILVTESDITGETATDDMTIKLTIDPT